MAKRDYGDGSVYEYPEGSGRWFAAVPNGHGGRTVRRATSAKAAEDKRKKLLARRDEGLSTGSAAITLTAFSNLWWERAPKEKGLAPKTLYDYRRTIERYLLPGWGTRRLEEFEKNVTLVIDMHRALRSAYSHAIAARAIAKISMLFNAAVRWQMMGKNPVDAVRDDLPTYTPQEGQPLTPAETRRLLDTVEGHRLAALYHIALTLGLRLGELLGLQWGDVDWKARTITIRRQAQEVAGKQSMRDRAKTDKGRTLPLPARLYARLAQLREAGVSSLFLFPSASGTVMRQSNFERHWRGGVARRYTKKSGARSASTIVGIRQKAGLPSGITPHDFRHTVATRLLEQGVPDEIRDAIMGHGKRKRQQARTIYAHATLTAMRRALEELEWGMWADEDNIAEVR